MSFIAAVKVPFPCSAAQAAFALVLLVLGIECLEADEVLPELEQCLAVGNDAMLHCLEEQRLRFIRHAADVFMALRPWCHRRARPLDHLAAELGRRRHSFLDPIPPLFHRGSEILGGDCPVAPIATTNNAQTTTMNFCIDPLHSSPDSLGARSIIKPLAASRFAPVVAAPSRPRPRRVDASSRHGMVRADENSVPAPLTDHDVEELGEGRPSTGNRLACWY